MDSLVEIELKDDKSFLIIKETLTRMGVPSKKTDTLYQSCHILHKAGKYYIVHFKELFVIDGKDVNITDEDIRRRNSIVHLLSQWKLLTVINSDQILEVLDDQVLKILSFEDKKSWKLVSKYTFNKKSVVYE